MLLCGQAGRTMCKAYILKLQPYTATSRVLPPKLADLLFPCAKKVFPLQVCPAPLIFSHLYSLLLQLEATAAPPFLTLSVHESMRARIEEIMAYQILALVAAGGQQACRLAELARVGEPECAVAGVHRLVNEQARRPLPRLSGAFSRSPDEQKGARRFRIACGTQGAAKLQRTYMAVLSTIPLPCSPFWQSVCQWRKACKTSKVQTTELSSKNALF
jgi:hypothetical protein